MKNQVFLILLSSLLFTFSSANAQSGKFKKSDPDLCASANGQSKYLKKPQPTFDAGVKAGINYSGQYTSSTANCVYFTAIIGIDAGLQLSYLLYAKQIDLGLAVGIEANLPLNVNLIVRYVLGLNAATTGTPYTEIWRN